MSHFTNVSFGGNFSVTGTVSISSASLGSFSTSFSVSGALQATISHLSTGAVTGSWSMSGVVSSGEFGAESFSESGAIGGTLSQVTLISGSAGEIGIGGLGAFSGQSFQFSGPINESVTVDLDGETAFVSIAGTMNWLLTSSVPLAPLFTSGDDVLAGTDGPDTVRGGGGNDQIAGGVGNDALFGDAGDDVVDGGAGNDRLSGGAGADVLIAGSGDNLLDGGAGNDTARLLGNRSDYQLSVLDGPNDSKLFFTLSGLEPGDVVNMVSKDGRVDRLAGVETVVFLGADVNDSADDTVVQVNRSGLLADARVFVASRYFADAAGTGSLTGTASDDVLDGLEGDDQLTGLGGNDVLDGGAGSDTLTGGAGNDLYIVDSAQDQVVELANQGTDTLRTTLASYTLGENAERLEYTGTGAFSGTGNARANILKGGAGNDTLVGGLGADRMEGGAGNDTYFVDLLPNADTLAAGDTVVELIDGGTADTVQSTVSYTLGLNVENLALLGTLNRNGTGNGANNSLTGNAGSNVLSGGAGNDTFFASGGNDRFVGGAGSDTLNLSLFSFAEKGLAGGFSVTRPDAATIVITDLDTSQKFTITGAWASTTADRGIESYDFSGQTVTLDLLIANTGSAGSDALSGGGGADVLAGLGGNDTLDGGAGGDTLIGGLGNDIYVVDSLADTVTELAGQGTDTVRTALGTYATLAEQVERLEFTGAGAFSGTGNTRANTLVGGAGNDTLDGGLGADRMEGGAGNDTYFVNLLPNADTLAAGDAVVELADGGTADTVRSTVSYTLGANVENLVLLGSANLNGTGNAGSNSLTGNDGRNSLGGGVGNDTLAGGQGSDRLTGGADADVFVFDSLPAEVGIDPGIDTIVDFLPGTDRIRLDDAIFTQSVFGEHLLYDQATGALRYDADGAGGAGAVLFALIGTSTHPVLTAGDFEIA